jgi:hypothetical protein
MKARKRINVESVEAMDALIDEYAEFDSGAITWHAKLDWILDKAERYCAALDDAARERREESTGSDFFP